MELISTIKVIQIGAVVMLVNDTNKRLAVIATAMILSKFFMSSLVG